MKLQRQCLGLCELIVRLFHGSTTCEVTSVNDARGLRMVCVGEGGGGRGGGAWTDITAAVTMMLDTGLDHCNSLCSAARVCRSVYTTSSSSCDVSLSVCLSVCLSVSLSVSLCRCLYVSSFFCTVLCVHVTDAEWSLCSPFTDQLAAQPTLTCLNSRR